MSRKNSNGVINSLAVIGESFRSIDISDEGILTLMDETMFLHLFESVEDFRQPWKVEYRLPNLLMIIFLCILENGKQPYIFIEDYIDAKKRFFSQYGLIEDGKCPSHDTIRRILTLLNADSLHENTIQGFYEFLRSLERNLTKQGDYRHIAVDGKEMRGSGRSKSSKSPKRNAAMLNVYDSYLLTAIRCVPVSDKENEIPVAQELLGMIEKKNVVFTADALHCQKDTAELIHDGKGVYVLTVKDNHPLLLEEIRSRFGRTGSKITKYELDQRTVEILDLSKKTAMKDEWKGLKCYVRMYSTKRSDPCERYFISNATDHRLIIDGIEKRWTVENDLHKPKDVDLGEDLVRSTDKNALQNIAVLDNLVIQLFRIYQAITGKEYRKARRYFQFNPIECLNTILAIMSSEEIVNSLVLDLKRRKRAR